MSRYKIFIEYDGTKYSGWQTQPKDLTIQDTLEVALSRILRDKIRITGSGRTDSGVHAEAQIAHFDYPNIINRNELIKSLWGVLPRDIAVWDIEKVRDDFHARFDGQARQYRYQILTRPSPLQRAYAWERFFDFDLKSMKICAERIKGNHDFESFCKYNPDVNHTRCEVTESFVERINPSMIIYRIRANRFLHHMVRSLIGTMVEVGLGKRTIKSFETLIDHPDRKSVGTTAPAKGLILEKVFYKK